MLAAIPAAESILIFGLTGTKDQNGFGSILLAKNVFKVLWLQNSKGGSGNAYSEMIELIQQVKAWAWINDCLG